MGILDLVFPKTCLGCGGVGQYICQSCLDKVLLLKPVCPYCEKASIDGFTHTMCKKVFGLDGLISIFKYEGVIKKAISSLKYKYATEIVQELCGYFVPNLRKQILTRTDPVKQATLIPIAIYWYRENNRGFNQTEEIGKIIAKEIGWGFESNLLIRTKQTIPQASLPVAERKKNLHGVFSVSPDHSISQYPNILLFDDVFTTGSTLHEAAKTLRRSGAKKVWGLTIAR